MKTPFMMMKKTVTLMKGRRRTAESMLESPFAKLKYRGM